MAGWVVPVIIIAVGVLAVVALVLLAGSYALARRMLRPLRTSLKHTPEEYGRPQRPCAYRDHAARSQPGTSLLAMVAHSSAATAFTITAASGSSRSRGCTSAAATARCSSTSVGMGKATRASSPTARAKPTT